MSRNGQNEAFLRTSFLSAANAPYIEDMQAEYERNPGAVSDEWRRFFESIKEPATVLIDIDGRSRVGAAALGSHQ